MRGEVHPHPLSRLEAVDARADGIHDPRASWFGVISSNGRGRPALSRAFQSVGFTPDTVMRTLTSPGPGSGRGRSTSERTEESPGWEYVIAFIGEVKRRRHAGIPLGVSTRLRSHAAGGEIAGV
ncbi:hypothetical protein HR12_41755 [Microbacterium sp. SUBG005]|nr:hypothetical protein HR12_41755 [Microbacterium sp. SUBG005]